MSHPKFEGLKAKIKDTKVFKFGKAVTVLAQRKVDSIIRQAEIE